MKFSELVQSLSVDVQHSSLAQSPNLDPELQGVAAVSEATAGTISYIEGDKYAKFVRSTAASALILPRNEALAAQATERGLAWLTVADPRLIFAHTIACFYQPYQPEPEIHPSAVIHPTATVGKSVYIGPHVVIQPRAVIGDGVCIHPNVTVYPDAKIGDRTVLHANCVIQERSQIGADCVIHAGAVVGSEGFGFVPSSQGLVKMHQSGYVVLEDNVEIGCNTTIDRPAVGETRIGRNTKLDNLVQIGHGCKVGQSCAMSSLVGLSGRVTIGNGVFIGGQVGVSNDVTVADGVMITAQSGLHKDITEAKSIVSGAPAMPNKAWRRLIIAYTKLPEIYQTMREMKRFLAQQSTEQNNK